MNDIEILPPRENLEDRMNKLLDVKQNISKEISEVKKELKKQQKDALENFDNDYDEVRENLRESLKEAHEALKELMDIAKDTEDTKAFGAVSSLLSTITNTSKTLLDISKDKKSIHAEHEFKKEEGAVNYTQTNNYVVQGSVQDVLKKIREAEEK